MIEYTHRLEFDVLTAPLAEIDRRALSQAWYSALHLASASAGSRPARVAPSAQSARSHKNPSAAAIRASRARVASNPRVVRANRERPVCQVAADRRSPRSQLARGIERVAARPLASARAASFAVRGPHGRVQILLRSQGGRTHLIAVCTPEARVDVARALEQARYALARGGIAACSVRVREAAR